MTKTTCASFIACRGGPSLKVKVAGPSLCLQAVWNEESSRCKDTSASSFLRASHGELFQRWELRYTCVQRQSQNPPRSPPPSWSHIAKVCDSLNFWDCRWRWSFRKTEASSSRTTCGSSSAVVPQVLNLISNHLWRGDLASNQLSKRRLILTFCYSSDWMFTWLNFYCCPSYQWDKHEGSH